VDAELLRKHGSEQLVDGRVVVGEYDAVAVRDEFIHRPRRYDQQRRRRHALRGHQHIGSALTADRRPVASLRHQLDVRKRRPRRAQLGAKEVEVSAVDDVREVEPVLAQVPRDEVVELPGRESYGTPKSSKASPSTCGAPSFWAGLHARRLGARLFDDGSGASVADDRMLAQAQHVEGFCRARRPQRIVRPSAHTIAPASSPCSSRTRFHKRSSLGSLSPR
jgi:hypothetical protein